MQISDTETTARLELLKNLVKDPPTADQKIRSALANHGGGHLNHSLFWRNLTAKNDGQPTGKLAAKLTQKFGSFQDFTEEFENAAIGQFGSGWAWLTVDEDDDFTIETTPNQLLPAGKVLLGLDVWEHAYYRDYRWNRADYVRAWWSHVDWAAAAQRLDAGLSKPEKTC
jgi:Fe-Mn family superoxide dismutase